MNMIKYTVGISSALLLAGSIAIASASAQVSASVGVSTAVNSSVVSGNISASADASTSMKEMRMPDGRMMVMGSSTRMSSTTRQQMLEQRQNKEIGTMGTRSSTEITARINSLNTLLTRVNAMTRLSASEKSSITTEVQNLISELTTLQAKIQVDASSTPVGQQGALSSSSPLRIDMQSITKDYRVYALVIPQLEILAAADRAQTIVTSLSTVSTKLQARITADQSAGDNVTSLQASLSDLNAKAADAQTQATGAVNATVNLTPDNGDATIAASNAAALKTARADIQTADSDIKAATADAQSIVKGIEALGGNSSASASVSASTSASVQ